MDCVLLVVKWRSVHNARLSLEGGKAYRARANAEETVVELETINQPREQRLVGNLQRVARHWLIISALLLPLESECIMASANGCLDELGFVDGKVGGGIFLDDLEDPAAADLGALFGLIGERAAKNSR